jgi:hypothetical protein
MPSNRLDSLHHLTTNTLVDVLPESLKQSLDDALSKGATREELLARVRRLTGGPGPHKGGWTYLAVHAYLFPERRNVE